MCAKLTTTTGARSPSRTTSCPDAPSLRVRWRASTTRTRPAPTCSSPGSASCPCTPRPRRRRRRCGARTPGPCSSRPPARTRPTSWGRPSNDWPTPCARCEGGNGHSRAPPTEPMRPLDSPPSHARLPTGGVGVARRAAAGEQPGEGAGESHLAEAHGAGGRGAGRHGLVCCHAGSRGWVPRQAQGCGRSEGACCWRLPLCGRRVTSRHPAAQITVHCVDGLQPGLRAPLMPFEARGLKSWLRK